MESKELISLVKIRDHAKAIAEYSKEVRNSEEFLHARETSDACAFNLLQIGEIAKSCLSSETKQAITSIPWDEIQGLRNRIVHGYDGIRMDIIFETVKTDIPKLIKELDKYVKAME